MSPNRTPRASVRAREAVLGAEVEDEVLGVGVCANAAHDAKTVFVKHMEERFTWQDTVAGVSVHLLVPVKWRGCCKGCLAFLGGGGGGDGDGDADVAMDEDEDVDMDDADVIQPVTLSAGAFGDEDFEDDA